MQNHITALWCVTITWIVCCTMFIALAFIQTERVVTDQQQLYEIIKQNERTAANRTWSLENKVNDLDHTVRFRILTNQR